jgi:hypothetical protein
MRWLYPLILLLSADYEEQYVFSRLVSLLDISHVYRCVMALVRGLNSNCPCPICLVPSTKLYDLSTTYPTRTVEDAKAFLELYLRDRVAGEAILKEHGLRPIVVRVSIASWSNLIDYHTIRMHSGKSRTPILTRRSRLIPYMSMTLVTGAITFSRSSKYAQRLLVVRLRRQLMNSMFFCYCLVYLISTRTPKVQRVSKMAWLEPFQVHYEDII